MKFAHQLTFNTNPDWRQSYIDYNKLKRLIYTIERVEAEEHHVADSVLRRSMEESRLPSVSFDGAERPLLQHSASITLANPTIARCHQDFRDQIQVELNKVVSFIVRELQKVTSEVANLEKDMVDVRQAHLTEGSESYFWANKAPPHLLQPLRKRAKDAYMELQDLLEFRHMNRDGFRKILKKHDKVTQSPLMAECMPTVEHSLPADQEALIQQQSDRVLELHATLHNQAVDQSASALEALRQRPTLEYQRPTVWRDMAELERHTAVVRVEEHGGAADKRRSRRRATHSVVLAFSVAAFVALLNLQLLDNPQQNACLAMITLLSLLWSTEALPLYVTSMLVPALTVMLRVLPTEDGAPLPAPEAAQHVFRVMFSPVIMLLLGGFAIAAALSKHFIAKAVAVRIMARVSRPRHVVLASMFIATFSSMWISNVAAPVLCYALVQPILRREHNRPMLGKSIVMGIAMASNVGGMTSPISSPQNIFAIAVLSDHTTPPNWLEWFAIALPVSTVINLAIWGLLLLYYNPDREVTEILPLRSSNDPINMTQVVVVMVSAVTVLLWCGNTALQGILGDQGIVAILPLAVFFGTGILDKDDFNGFLWHVVMLAQGGLVLSEAVKQCGVLELVADAITSATADLDLWSLVAVFCAVVAVCTTFISHTVGAMVILPVVKTVGQALPVPHPRLLVLANVLMCSGAMGLPVSGFPNMTASALETSLGTPYAELQDFLVIGLTSTVIAWSVIVTLGYLIMYCIGW
eukprot:jgi/Ulvmu1/8197/UM041_0006.1